MATFFSREMAELTHQLTFSPRRLRIEQIAGIERLLSLIAADRTYPLDFVCYHITKYRRRGPAGGPTIAGKALICDLVTTAEVLSRKAALGAAELGEPFYTHAQVARMLDVSTKTVRRWRQHGLLGLRVVFEDGVNRLAFLQRTVERFKKQHASLVSRGASFKQLTPAERRWIVERARELIAARPMRLHAAAAIIAQETSRAVETVRYTLRRHDAAHPAEALFADGGPRIHDERHLAIWRCHQAGDSPAAIARAFACTPDDVAQVLRVVQVQQWARMAWDHVSDPLFDAPQAEAMILEAPEPPGDTSPSRAAPRDLPAYLRALYLTPLLRPQQEHDLFRRFNFVKFKAARALKAIDPLAVTAGEFDELSGLIAQVESLRQRIIRANLRLVVSIAKKHVGWSPHFFEVISDGNVSLMRAVEKFDYTRGTRFSTYATWSIMKNYARSIPEQRYHQARWVTGQDELLHAAPDARTPAESESDRRRVRELIEAGLAELSPREREIVRGHFGLSISGEAVTLDQLGHRFGLTKERIRQIEQKALARLRELLRPSLADVIAD